MIREPYTAGDLNRQLAAHFGIPGFLLSARASWSFRDAPVRSGRYPVVIFNHAIGSFTRQNFSNLEGLASQGMIVMALGHPGDSLIARNALGQALYLDETSPVWQRWQAVQRQGKSVATNLAALLAAQRQADTLEAHARASQALARAPQFAAWRPLVQVWAADTRAVIAALSNNPHPILQHADATRITLMGHSLGGLVTLELARQPPPGVRAAISLDAPWVQYADQFSSVRVPVLAFVSTQNLYEGQDLSARGCLNLPLAASGNARIVEIAGTAHFSFTDLNYFPLIGRFSPILGSVDNQRMGRLLERSLEAFQRRITQNLDLEPPLLANESGVHEQFFQPQ